MNPKSRNDGNGHGKTAAGEDKAAAPTEVIGKVLGRESPKPLIKRFYKEASVGEGAFFQVLLDGRVVKTPAKRALFLPTRQLAQAVVEEWSTQGEFVNPATMPLTRFSNTAIDQVSAALAEVASDITAYAGSDLVCYRAHEPDDLVALQSARWDPVIEWAREALRAHFTVVKGVVPVEQPRTAIFAVGAALEPHEPFRLTGLHVLTTLTGSALLALAHARGFLSAKDAWSAAHVDEDFQIKLWGIDDEAAARRTHRLSEFEAASRLLSLL